MQKFLKKSQKKTYSNTHIESASTDGRRIQVLFLILCAMFLLIVIRLFSLMVVNGSLYTKLAALSQESYAELLPKRGQIYTQDSRTGEQFPLALNKYVYLMYADTRKILDDDASKYVLEHLTPLFNYDDVRKAEILTSLNKRTDPYEPIEKRIEEDLMQKIKDLKLPGIQFTKIPARVYPEGHMAAQVIGFLGQNDDQTVGKYGVEGFFQKELAGKEGILSGTRSAKGEWIPFDSRMFDGSTVEDGADIKLTIDRTLQYHTCERLRQGMLEYNASSASLIIMEPQTGAIRVMCSLPDFDPNSYGAVDDIRVYNNSTIFTAYEPGSIFKPVTMGAAINEGLVEPGSYFHDPGVRADVCKTPIRNAELKVYNDTTMTGVLENSINTGMIYVSERLGTARFRDYVDKFGFGLKSGITLDTESAGNISSLLQNKKTNKIDCYTATGSFGQGLTVTPLQMVNAYATIANGGKLMSPYIVDEIDYKNGKSVKTQPIEIRRVLTERTASLLSGMLVNVVEKGHAQQARSEEYYIAGKTGTAQIPGQGGYTDETIHSFVGFAPVDNPKFVMIVKYEKPERKYAESTAVPVFGDIAKFIFDYYEVVPGRK